MMTKWASILVSHSVRNYKEKIFLQFPKIIIDGASSELMGLFVKVLKWMERKGNEDGSIMSWILFPRCGHVYPGSLLGADTPKLMQTDGRGAAGRTAQ